MDALDVCILGGSLKYIVLNATGKKNIEHPRMLGLVYRIALTTLFLYLTILLDSVYLFGTGHFFVLGTDIVSSYNQE